MAEKRTGGPYIWVTTSAKLLTGENFCEWAGWFKAHHRNWQKPPSDFDSTAWMLEHTALVNTERDGLERTGYDVYTENQNLFRLKGATTTIAGKPDLIGEKTNEILISDAKTGNRDAAEWLPELNQCWYVDRVVQVRRKYQLTIDQAEVEAIDRVLAGCESTEMVFLAQEASTTTAATPTPTEAPEVDALAMYDGNGNGRITCAEARAHGIAPVHRGHPAYQYMRDADGDGVVCE